MCLLISSFCVFQVIATMVTLVNGKNSIHEAICFVRNHLSKFEGVSRRFELIGKINGCQIYDDYAHHPTEVRAVLQAAREKFLKQAIWVVFQPHTFRFSLNWWNFLGLPFNSH